MRVFNPNTDSYRDLPPDACFKRHEQGFLEDQTTVWTTCILEKLSMHPSLHLSFQLQAGWVSQPLLSTGDLPTYLLHVKRDESYSTVIRWMRCRLGFALTRSAIMCLRGCRSIHSNNAPPSISQCVVEGQIPTSD